MNIAAIILAAGKGTRFGKCEVNKTAFKLEGKSLIQRGIDNISEMMDKIYVVVGYKKATVMESIKSNKVIYVDQKRRLGTGHAVKVALKVVANNNSKPDLVLVGNGDHLFNIKSTTISKLITQHIKDKNDVTILSTRCDNPVNKDNGRVVKINGKVVRIVEKKDFNEKIKAIKELNSGTYIFTYDAIIKMLKNKKISKGKELYLTQVIFNLDRIGSMQVDFEEVGTGVNTREELLNYQVELNN